MWIRSQNNHILANVNSLRICKSDIYGCVCYLIHGHYDRYEQELGVYSTKEKALRVLDEIQRFIYHIDNLYATFQMPADDEVVTVKKRVDYAEFRMLEQKEK